MKKTIQIILVLVSTGTGSFADTYADSLLKELQHADTYQKVDIYRNLGKYYIRKKPSKALEYSKKGLLLAKEIKNDSLTSRMQLVIARVHINSGEYNKAIGVYKIVLPFFIKTRDTMHRATVAGNMGICYKELDQYDAAIKSYKKALKLSKSMNDSMYIGACLQNIGLVYTEKGDMKTAMEYYQTALNIFEKIENQSGISICIGNIANIYSVWNKFEKSLEFYTKMYKIALAQNDIRTQIRALSNSGIAYIHLDKIDTAAIYYEKAKAAAIEAEDKVMLARIYANLGDLYLELDMDPIALENYTKSLKIKKEIRDTSGIMNVNLSIGNFYTKQGKFSKAFTYYRKAEKFLQVINSPLQHSQYHLDLYEYYNNTGNFKKSLEHYKAHIQFKDSIFNNETSQKVADFEVKYKTAEKEKEIALLNQQKDFEQKEREKEKKYNRRIQVLFAIGGIMLILVVIILINRYRLKKKANKELTEMNLMISQQKDEILTQNEEIIQQKEEILAQAEYLDKTNQELSDKNQKITDSIEYALRIQQAILPSEEMMRKHLNDLFLFYRPKDIVSGDFYWYYEDKNHCWYAVADCTGHGVPGAFMSMIGNTLLNEIITENIFSPSDILMELNKRVLQSLSQSGGKQDDGMDISVCRLDFKKKELHLALANHTAWYFDTEIKNIEGDIFSIGGSFSLKQGEKYKEHIIKVTPGMKLYMFSDGFPDQFGKNNKKFTGKRFMELIAANAGKPMPEQLEILEKTLDDWKGTTKQLDDILVMGLEV